MLRRLRTRMIMRKMKVDDDIEKDDDDEEDDYDDDAA